MKQAPGFDCLSFDPVSLFQNGLAASEVDIGRCKVLQALVVASVVVMIDEGVDLVSQIAGQVIVLQQDAVLQGLMPALDLALGLRVIRVWLAWEMQLALLTLFTLFLNLKRPKVGRTGSIGLTFGAGVLVPDT